MMMMILNVKNEGETKNKTKETSSFQEKRFHFYRLGVTVSRVSKLYNSINSFELKLSIFQI
jgi:hypothetical protein